MSIPAHRLYPIVALALLAGGTLWLDRVSAPEPIRSPVAERGKPDFSAENTRLISFDAQGQQRYELHTDRIIHYPHTDITELVNPRLDYQSGGRSLHLQARQGEVRQQGDEIVLTGEVRGVRSPLGTDPELTFTSETLTVWPEDERALSNTPVVLTRGGMVIRARGMQADNLFGTLKLGGGVNATMPRSRRTTP